MDLLPRLHERLLSSLAASTGPKAPLTVGDLYQRLIAYRSVRNELGVMELASYEHALLRLLSGEAGLLRMLDRTATDEVQRELASVNPILGIYRDFATVEIEITHDLPVHAPGMAESAGVRELGAHQVTSDLWSGPGFTSAGDAGEIQPIVSSGSAGESSARVSRTQDAASVGDEHGAPTRDRPTGARDGNPVVDLETPWRRDGLGADNERASSVASKPDPISPTQLSGGIAEPPVEVPGPYGIRPRPQQRSANETEEKVTESLAQSLPRRTDAASPGCAECGRRLPHLREIRFCPYCGTACPPRACKVCATPIEGDWSFCVCCGTPAGR